MAGMSWYLDCLCVDQCSAGLGVFTRNAISKGTVVARFGGHIMTIEDESLLPSPLSDFGLQIDEKFVIGPAKESEICLADRFNHSCEPNLGFKWQLFLVAIKDISAGSQLNFDYAMAVSGSPYYEIECSCGLSSCREKITSNDWMNSALQEKYRGYFQPYLEEKIRDLHRC